VTATRTDKPGEFRFEEYPPGAKEPARVVTLDGDAARRRLELLRQAHTQRFRIDFRSYLTT